MQLDIDKRLFCPVFYPHIADTTAEQVFFGGAGSGKSKFVFQRTVLDMIDQQSPLRNFLIVRNTRTSNADSTFNEVQQEADRFKVSPFMVVNKSDLTITCRITQSQAFFRGLDDPEKLKSTIPRKGVITDVVMEEASECPESAYDDLWMRLRGVAEAPKRFTMMFNPVSISLWQHRRWEQHFTRPQPRITRADGLLIHHSTHRDNPFLTEADHKRYEGYAGRSEYHDQVYGKGEWGVLGGTILTNWRVDDLGPMRDAWEDRMRNGCDFGFSSDAAAVVRCAYDKVNRRVYVFDVPVYEHGLTNQRLSQRIHPIVGNQIVWCDSAEPKSIAEMMQCDGAPINAQPVRKGRDSVWHSIQWLQNCEIVLDKSACQPLVNELSQWQWKKDRFGVTQREPVGVNDHAISALRYALEGDMVGASDVQVW